MVIFFLALLAIAAFLQWQSTQRDLSSLQVEMSSSQNIVEQGETLQIVLLLKNTSKWIFPFLGIELKLAEGMEIDGAAKFSTWLLPRQQVKIVIPVKMSKRGRYLTHGLYVHVGDFLGIDEDSEFYDCYIDVVVLPKPYELNDEYQLSGGIFGDISARRFIFEDPILTTSFRDYTGREPLKQISWTSSAKAGKLVVKQYDYTQEASVIMAVNMDAECDEKTMEDTFSVARTVCRKLEEQHIQYAFTTNSITSGDMSSWDYVMSGYGFAHEFHILEGLGRGTYSTSKDCRTLCYNAVRQETNAFALVLVSPVKDDENVMAAKAVANAAGINFICITPNGENND